MKNSVCSIKTAQFKEQELGALLSMSYAFKSPCQRAPLPSYKDPMNFWVLKVALQRLPCPPDVTGPKTGRYMKACVRMMGAGWHWEWSLLIWSRTWFDRLYFHVRDLQRLLWKSFSKPAKPLLSLETLKFCSSCWNIYMCYEYMSCVLHWSSKERKEAKIVVRYTGVPVQEEKQGCGVNQWSVVSFSSQCPSVSFSV